MKIGRVFTGIGLLLIAAALCLTVFNFVEDSKAGKSADAALAAVLPQIEKESTPVEGKVINTIYESEDPSELPIEEVEYPNYVLNPEIEMPYVTVDGRDYIGMLYIVPMEKQFAVISEWSYENLDVAPCRYSGSVYLDNMVICAHNYSLHFGPLRNLKIGDQVRFTDMDGNQFRYTVSEIETLQPSMSEEMMTGDWDLTLFTCTVGGQTRLALRCEREDKT